MRANIVSKNCLNCWNKSYEVHLLKLGKQAAIASDRTQAPICFIITGGTGKGTILKHMFVVVCKRESTHYRPSCKIDDLDEVHFPLYVR